MKLELEVVKDILGKEKLMSLGTTANGRVDNSVVCYAFDEQAHLYFGSYSDTLKCRNIGKNPQVAITAGTLQIHGTAKIVPWGSTGYEEKRKIYDERFPQYKELFQKVDNELYEIIPLAIWNYNPSLGEMNRDEWLFDADYVKSIEPYKFHQYMERSI